VNQLNQYDKEWKEKKLNHYDNKILYDEKDEHYVMGDWEDPVMKAHAEITCRNGGHILEVGFGMGISANYIQEQDIESHTIIELNDEIYEKAVEWVKDKPNTEIISGDWKCLELNKTFDAIFFDAHVIDPMIMDFPIDILKYCKVGTILTFFNHLWKPETLWTRVYMDKDKIKLYEIDARVPENLENGYKDPTHKIYYLPEWIITEDDTPEKYRKLYDDVLKKIKK
jgi:protein arginine N-methyltransferase 2